MVNDNENNENNKNNENIDIETLSTFLTDNEIRPDELKKIDEEKKENISQNNSNIYDININSIDDLIDILEKNSYDFAMIEPMQDIVKISFKKDQIVKEIKNIKFHVYLNLLLQAKKISKLNLEETTNEQKGSGEYRFRNKNLDILSRTVPSNFGEILYIKYKESEKIHQNKQNIKKSITIKQALGFLGIILFISLILGTAFLIFIVFNAKTVEDVNFFTNLGINLNDINSFLLKITTFVFSSLILIQTIILIILFFKGFLTKKEFKRRKIILFTSAVILLIITGSTGSGWMYLDKTIRNLPNWQEMSYGNIQIYDNNILKSDSFDKSSALILDYTTIIGPIDLKFDLNYLQKDEARKGFKIQKYIWDFGDGEKIETQIPEIIQNFSKKGNYKINLILEGIDSRFPNKISSKSVSDIPEINISYVVKITENSLYNGGKTISFDANDLKQLGEIEWYFKEDLRNPTFIGEYFQPSKVYFEEDMIGMVIKRKGGGNPINKIFVVSGKKYNISGEIKEIVSINNDLNYTFRVENLKNTAGAGFIKNFIWTIDGRDIIKEADILKLEESSEINFTFINYGKKIIKVVIVNTIGKSVEIKKEIDIQKKLGTINLIEFIGENNSKIDNVKYDEKIREYSLFDIGVPTKIIFDAKYVKIDDSLYTLDEITWDVGSDGNIESKEKSIEENFYVPGFKEITVNYKFVHRKDKNKILNLKDKINLEFVEKEAIVSLEIKTDSEYVPVIALFDASASKVKNDNIVKFIYDYGDGIIEERDSLNSHGHRYLKEGNYKIKLTIVTEKGKEYSISKNLILKAPLYEGKINTSMKKAPVGQEIDFLSTGSVGQIIGYHWDFGDGNTSNEANPSHAFSKPGEYKVKLTLEYANNNIITLYTNVQITE